MAALKDVFQRALGLHQAGRLTEAQALYRQVLRADARHFDSLHLLGLAQVQGGELAGGIAAMRGALALRGDFPEAHYNLGHALLTAGQPEEALAAFTRAISLNAGDAQYHLEAGNALKDLARPGEAIAAYDRALALDRGLAEAWNNRGVALKDEDRHAEALASYDKAIALQPRYAEAYSNRGNALKELRRLDEALSCHDTAIGLRPSYAEAHYNRGNLLSDMKRPDEALASFDAALRINPAYAEAQNNKAHLLLAMGRFADGFEAYAARWRTAGFGPPPFATDIPKWNGEDCESLLLWAEQGIGDEIFYASLLSLLPQGGMRVTLAADKRLHDVYRRSFPGIEIVDSDGLASPVSGYAAQAPLGDLGAILRLDDHLVRARRMPYLLPDAQRRRQILADNPVLQRHPVCGLSWKSANKSFGAQKSLRLADLAPLLRLPGLTFVNLQYGKVADEIAEVRESLGVAVHEAAGVDVFNDIDGLMALVDCCDVVLTTSNVTAHVAGAIGKTSAVLVPTGKGCLWYWQGGANNLWYPGLHRIAQGGPGDWDAAIAAAVEWIRNSA